MSKKPRPITAVDRVLAYGDQIAVAAGDAVKARRRTHRRCGGLDVIVVETSDEPTTVYLTHDAMDSAIIETTGSELVEAAAFVRELMTKPPPVRRKR